MSLRGHLRRIALDFVEDARGFLVGEGQIFTTGQVSVRVIPGTF